MTIRQILLGVTAAGVTLGLLVHRLPSKQARPIKIAKLQSAKPASKVFSHSSPSAKRNKNRSDQPFKTARA